jgi:DNA polymerase I-like protein with 3'-5' exonuclease and polymerase domains
VCLQSTERKVGKIINFGLVYGMTKWGLQKKINAALDHPIELHQAEAFRSRYFELYKGVLAYQDEMIRADFIATLGGRYWTDGHYMLPKGAIARFNYPIQSSCAEGLKIPGFFARSKTDLAISRGYKHCAQFLIAR